MLTSPRTNPIDHFVPSHHLALITQPVLGARSRSRKKPSNLPDDTSPTSKDKLHPMATARRGSYNDSPPLIIPVTRVDTSQYHKGKSNSNSHRESSDSGLDLSSSTTSSGQLQQHGQPHAGGHRPLSALNEDSSTDDGYHDEHQPVTYSTVRLRFPPVSFGRNRSMEDMLSSNKRDQQQPRSGSFTDDRQLKLPLRYDPQMKRSSDGALLDLLDTPADSYRRTNGNRNELLYPSTTQHRSLNDLTNTTSSRASRNESSLSTTNVNNLSMTQTVIRKPNTSTLKPLRKKTKLNIIIEPALPLTSSRLSIYDEQINTRAAATSSSSSQTTPRSTQPPVPQHIKSKATTPLGYYINQEQIKAHVNRSVVERQHPPAPARRNILQQPVPFDASPSKVNKLLIRHHAQQHYPSSHMPLSPSRQAKQTSRAASNDETLSLIEDEKRKQIHTDNFRESVEKQRLKHKEDLHNEHHPKLSRRRKDTENQPSATHNAPRYFLKTIQRQPDKFPRKKIAQHRFSENTDERYSSENAFGSTPRHQYEYRERRLVINHPTRNIIKDRYGSGQSTSTVGKAYDSKNVSRLPVGHQLDPLHINPPNERRLSRPTDLKSPYATQKIASPPRLSRFHLQSLETSPTRNPILLTQTELSDHPTKPKPQAVPTSKTVRIQPTLPTNTYHLQREREISRLSDASKTDSIHSKQPALEKASAVSFQSHSPTSWSVISEHQTDQEKLDAYEKTHIYHRESSQDTQIDDHANTPPRTFRVPVDVPEPAVDGRYVIPSNDSQGSSLIDHTYPFTFTPDLESTDNQLFEGNSQPKEKSNLTDVDTLEYPSPKKKHYSSPPPPKVTITSAKDEVPSAYDSDDGWSDDSAELLYVDERYAREKGKPALPAHLSSQQQHHHHYQVQQQNVLLQ